MTLVAFMKLLHVLTGFWFISGLVGRDVTYWQAAKAADPHAVNSLLKVSDFFERWAVISGSVAVLAFGLLTAWLQKWPMLGFLQGTHSNWLLVSLILFIGTFAVIPPLRLIPRRNQRAQALEEALAQGRMTAELNAALKDKVVITFRVAELIVMVLIIILMVTKPF